MSSVASAQAQPESNGPPSRFLSIICPYGVTNGTATDRWVGSKTGDYALQASDLRWILEPLTPYLDNLAIISNTFMRSRAVLGGGNSHANLNSLALMGSRGAQHGSIDFTIGEELNRVASNRIYGHLGAEAMAARLAATLKGEPAIRGRSRKPRHPCFGHAKPDDGAGPSPTEQSPTRAQTSERLCPCGRVQ